MTGKWQTDPPTLSWRAMYECEVYFYAVTAAGITDINLNGKQFVYFEATDVWFPMSFNNNASVAQWTAQGVVPEIFDVTGTFGLPGYCAGVHGLELSPNEMLSSTSKFVVRWRRRDI